ncbi:hypothetical protein C2G38_438442 [Gigaspora rosea]|uniref:RING-type domain-containing protein n=1 Tax=Gigaspora rosea TaxID=44941 RepID=A0A397UAP9_9GLOM|nr:hypothetical protein C2G38_438442 [Gigaspora rosea]
MMNNMNHAEEIKQLKRNIEVLNQELNFREQIIEDLEANLNRFEVRCTICLEYMSNTCTISCGHTFCYDCLYKWFTKQKKCPTCCVKITIAPVLSFVIKDIIDHYIKIKSYDEEIRLEKKNQLFKTKSNPWGSLLKNQIQKQKIETHMKKLKMIQK